MKDINHQAFLAPPLFLRVKPFCPPLYKGVKPRLPTPPICQPPPPINNEHSLTLHEKH